MLVGSGVDVFVGAAVTLDVGLGEGVFVGVRVGGRVSGTVGLWVRVAEGDAILLTVADLTSVFSAATPVAGVGETVCAVSFDAVIRLMINTPPTRSVIIVKIPTVATTALFSFTYSSTLVFRLSPGYSTSIGV